MASTTQTLFKAYVIDVDNVARVVEWDVTETGTLPHVQKAVGGLVDVVRLASNLDMWVNDEGLFLGFEVNESATYIANRHGFIHQPYFGTAVFTGGADEDGNTLPLGDDQIAFLDRARRLWLHR